MTKTDRRRNSKHELYHLNLKIDFIIKNSFTNSFSPWYDDEDPGVAVGHHPVRY